MLDLVFLEWSFVVVVSVIVAATAVYWLAPIRIRAGAEGSTLDGLNKGGQILLFDGAVLIDASAPAREAFATDDPGFGWANLHDALRKRFPEFPKSPAVVQKQGRVNVAGEGKHGADEVCCEWLDGVTRVELRRSIAREGPLASPILELKTLRMAMDRAPYPVWHIDPDRNLNWNNAAYDALLKKVSKDGSEKSEPIFLSAPENKKARASVAVAGGEQKLWFDVFVFKQKKGFLCYAIDINAVVDAEIAQRNFVQTLAKTFAQLSIGLAIFDRNRQLALFNPALIDLTALPADFLSARPNLLTFFDRLRDHRMMPEPKNYGSWRHQMADLVAAASDGRYQETWTLPSGAVYSVSGRPHPDGAVAFLFEDITAEITLTRRFRTDLEISQSVMDQMEGAIAVFSENGALCFCNLAYRKLWSVDPETSFVRMTVLDATRVWQSLCRPTPMFGEVREFVGLRENRVEWWEDIELITRQKMTCGVFPVSHGATMVVFNDRDKSEVPAEASGSVPVLEPAQDC